jgi:hypothetical protein
MEWEENPVAKTIRFSISLEAMIGQTQPTQGLQEF